MPMTDNIHRHAPEPVGDTVSGGPPVPITVWPVPAPRTGETMSNAMGVRLVHNLTHRFDLIIDLAAGPQLARAIIAAGRRSHLHGSRAVGWEWAQASLIVTGWPTGDPATRNDFFGRCRNSLLLGGCVAVLLPHADVTEPVDVIAAAKKAGLSYLQHVVAADRPPVRGQQTALDIHTDVLIMTRSATENGGSYG
jgi:hypothetical protein